MIDVEFSFAMHNRTGKYFIGRDIIEDNAKKIDQVLYWRTSTSPANPPPSGLGAKVIGRMAKWESVARQRHGYIDCLLPKIRSSKPVLHLDPYSTICHRLASYDYVLCHDIGPLTHPNLFPSEVVQIYAKVYTDIATVKPHMIYVSIATQNAFRDLFPGTMASEQVIYPPLRTEMLSSSLEPVDIGGPFILTVGSVGLRKNTLRAIQAYEKSALANHNISFVICGGREPGYEDVAKAAAETKGVKLLSYVTDMQLNWLYRNAIGFVLPSLLEGFGIPVAEAIFAGLVPLVSAGSVLHEVAGEGAILVDPYDIGDISTGMLHLLNMSDDEKSFRRKMLCSSIARFTRSTFRASWQDFLIQSAN